MKFNDGPAPPRGETLLETRVASRLELLTPLAVGVTSEAISHGLIDESGRDRLELCLQEAIKNAMVHGNRLDPCKQVTVRLFRDAEGWGVSVRDQGDGFTEASIPDPDDPAFPLRESGRGIHILRHMLEGIAYWAGGREVVLFPGREPPAAPEPAPPPLPHTTGSLDILPRGDILVVRIKRLPMGEETSNQVFRDIQAVLEEALPRVLVVDLCQVPYLSSVAIGRLIGLYKACLRVSTGLRLAGLSPSLADVFRQTRIDTLLPSFSDVEAAAAAP